MKKHPLEVIPTPYQGNTYYVVHSSDFIVGYFDSILSFFDSVFPWAVPKLDHTQDRMRAEDCKYLHEIVVNPLATNLI